MRLLLFVILIILATSHFANCQTRALDSLLSLTVKNQMNDSSKVELWGSISNLYYGIDIDLMKSYADSCKLLSEKITYSKGIVDANQKLALYYRLNGSFDTALYLNSEALHLSNQTNYNLGKAKCNLTFANIYVDKNELEKSILYFDEALKWFVEIDHKRGAAAVALNKGVVHRKMSEFSDALKSYQLAQGLYQEAGDTASQALAFRNIAILYNNLGDIPASTENYLKALEIAQQSGNKFFEINTMLGIGLVYLDQQNYDEAKNYFNQSLKLATASGNKNQISKAYANLGMVHLSQKKLQQALDYFNKAVELSNEIADDFALSRAFNGMAEIYVQMGRDSLGLSYYFKALELRKEAHEKKLIAETLIDIAQFYQSMGNYYQSEMYFKQAINIAMEDKNVLNIRDAAKGLSDIYEIKSNYKASLRYYKLYEEMADSLVNETKTKKITSQLLNFNHEKELEKIADEQKEKEHLQELEKRRIQSIRNYFAIALGFSIIILVVILLALRRRKIANEKLSAYNQDITKKNKEIKNISDELIKLDNFKQSMTSMLVHDLKSPLNTIINFPKSNYSQYTEAVYLSGMAMLNMVENILDVQKFEEAAVELKQSSFSLFSLVLKSIEEVKVLIQEKSIKINNHIDVACICWADKDLVHRVVVNLLTNAIKYSPVNSSIHVSCTELKDTEQIEISISDEGPGVADNLKTKIFDKYAQSEARKLGSIRSTGLGLTFCKLAIEAHGGEIGVKDNLPKGSIFWFRLSKGVHSVESEISNKNIKEERESIVLNKQEIELLKDFANKLNHIAIYKSTSIREVISDIPDSTENIVRWKHLLLESVFNGNEKEFRNLIQLV